jgi:ATP-binding cassette subfamily F protein 2
MPSDSKKKDQQRKKDARSKKVNDTSKPQTNGTSKEPPRELTQEELLCQQLEEEARLSADAR